MAKTSWRILALALIVLYLSGLVSVEAQGILRNGRKTGKSLFPKIPAKAWELPSHPSGAVVNNPGSLFNSAMPGVPRNTPGSVVQTMGVKTEADSWLHRNMHPTVVPPQPKAPEPLIYRTVHAVVGEGLTSELAGTVPVAAQKHMLMDIPDPSNPSSEPPSWRILSNPDIPMPPLPSMAPQPPHPKQEDVKATKPAKATKAPAASSTKNAKIKLDDSKDKKKKQEKKEKKETKNKTKKVSLVEQGGENQSTDASKLAALKMEILNQQKIQQQLLRDQALEIERLRSFIATSSSPAPILPVSAYFSGKRNPNAVYSYATQFPYQSLYPQDVLPNLLPVMPDQSDVMHRANMVDTVYADARAAARTRPYDVFRHMLHMHNTNGVFTPGIPGETQAGVPPPGWTNYYGKLWSEFKPTTKKQADGALNNYDKAVHKYYDDIKKSYEAARKKHGEEAILTPKQPEEEASFVETASAKVSNATNTLANAAAKAADTAKTVPPLVQAEKKVQNKTQSNAPTMRAPPAELKASDNKKPQKASFVEINAEAEAEGETESEMEVEAEAAVDADMEAEAEVEAQAETEAEAENQAQQPQLDLEDMIAPHTQLPKPVAASLLEAAHASDVASALHGQASTPIAKQAEQALIRNSLRLVRMRSADEFDAQNGFADRQMPSLAETASMLKDRTLIPTTQSSAYGHGIPYGIPKPVGFRGAPYDRNPHETTAAEITASRSSLLALDGGRVRAVGAEEAFLGSASRTKLDEQIQGNLSFELPSEWLNRPQKSPLPEMVEPPQLEIERGTPLYDVQHALI